MACTSARWTTGLAAALTLAALTPALAAAPPAPAPPVQTPAQRLAAWTPLPDWSGVWQMNGNTVFDRATVEPPGGAAGTAGVRERPPYNATWEAKYVKAIKDIADGNWPDPLSYCGIPAGIPRMMNLPDGYEWAITPKQVWMVSENGANIRRIYTDGRPHPTGDDLLETYTGHSIGHWEGDTLVVDTVGLRDDVIVDRTGVTLSNKRRVIERIRKLDENTLEARITVEDPVALTRPWSVTKTYRRLPKGSYIFDYACAENNRNPVDESGRTLTTDGSGKPIAN